MCRVSTLKALPLDEEIAAAECADAGEFMQKLRETDTAAWEGLVKERALPWGHSAQLPQPVTKLVQHLLAMMAHQAGVRGLHAISKKHE